MLKNFFRREHCWYAAVLLIAGFLIFFRLDRADMQTDGAVYSLRSLGYLDYLNTATYQSTPLDWFGSVPWWSRLSFHDAPPLVFLIQFVFFSLFGGSTLVARIPGAVAGVGSVVLTMAIGHRLWGRRAGLFAGLLLASSSLFTWAAREPYLESVETFFILLCLFAFLGALDDQRWWPWWGVTLGLALLTKYTAVLLLPATLGYLLVYARPVFRNRRLWVGLALALALLSPLAVYNFQLYRTRGHFDLQLSKLVPATWGSAKEDWPKLYADVGQPKSFADYASSTWRYFQSTASAPWFWLAAAATAGWTWWILVRPKIRRQSSTVVWLGLVALIAFFVFNGPAPRFLPPAAPLLALLAAGGITVLSQQLSNPFVSRAAFALALGVVAVEFAVNANTNLAYQPHGSPPWHIAVLRLRNDGFQQLAKHLAPVIRQQPGYGFSPVRTRDDLVSDFADVAGQDVILYQSRLRWFSTFWYFQQYTIYHDVYLLSDLDLAGVAAAQGNPIAPVNFFRERGARRLLFVAGVNDGVFESGSTANPAGVPDLEAAFVENIRRGAPGGLAEIKGPTGQLAFRVYTLDFAAADRSPVR